MLAGTAFIKIEKDSSLLLDMCVTCSQVCRDDTKCDCNRTITYMQAG